MHDVSRRPVLTVALAMLAGAIFYSPYAPALQYDRAAVGRGEVWRLATGQWAHWSADHLLWDAIVFVALGIACERRGRRSFAWAIAIASVVVPIAVHVACPTIATFRGLSGIDSALFAIVILRIGGPVGALALIAFAAKSIDEIVGGAPVFAAATFTVVPASHLVGFLVGVVVGWISSCNFVASPRVR